MSSPDDIPYIVIDEALPVGSVTIGNNSWRMSTKTAAAMQRRIAHAVGSPKNYAVNLSAEEIEAGKSPAGGYTYDQLADWGVPIPPPKGWKRTLMEGGGF